jgi:hypothetical protein
VELGCTPTCEEIEAELARRAAAAKWKVGSSNASEVSHPGSKPDRQSASTIVSDSTCDHEINERMSEREGSLKLIMQHLKIANTEGMAADTELGGAGSAHNSSAQKEDKEEVQDVTAIVPEICS